MKTSNVMRTNGTGKHEGPPAAYAAAAAGAVSPRPGSALSSSSANPVCTSTDKDCFAVRSTCERTSNPGKTPPEKCRSCRNHRSKLAGCGRTRRRPQAENRQASNLSENWNRTSTLSCAHARHILAAPLRRATQRGTAHSATRAGPTPAILGEGARWQARASPPTAQKPSPAERKTTTCKRPTENN